MRTSPIGDEGPLFRQRNRDSERDDKNNECPKNECKQHHVLYRLTKQKMSSHTEPTLVMEDVSPPKSKKPKRTMTFFEHVMSESGMDSSKKARQGPPTMSKRAFERILRAHEEE